MPPDSLPCGIAFQTRLQRVRLPAFMTMSASATGSRSLLPRFRVRHALVWHVATWFGIFLIDLSMLSTFEAPTARKVANLFLGPMLNALVGYLLWRLLLAKDNSVRASSHVTPLFPALRSYPMALSGASRRKQIPSMRNGHERAGDIAIPCVSGTCSYAAPNAKSGAGKLLLQPRICCG